MADRYRNPVYAGYFADPFVWRHDGAYYAVGTGGPEANLDLDCVRARVAAAGATSGLFPLLRSEDLVNWTSLGTALSPPDPAFGDYFSAPEVAFAGGAFHLYYSVGRLWQVHQLRVATSRHPEGPYVDSGRRLLHPFECYFANDPSPFCDDDGTWYLFYQRDFVDVDEVPLVEEVPSTSTTTPATALVAAWSSTASPTWRRCAVNRRWWCGRDTTGSASMPDASGTARRGTGTSWRAPQWSSGAAATGASTAAATGRRAATASITPSPTTRAGRGPTTGARRGREFCGRCPAVSSGRATTPLSSARTA
jgi:hypothetical protein